MSDFNYFYNGKENLKLYCVFSGDFSKKGKFLIIYFQVISARKGEFETGFDRGGQTREHALLAKTAGVKHLIVLINKMDDPSVEWDQKR